MGDVPALWMYAPLVLSAALAMWNLLLKERLSTAIDDIRYWRASADMWREKAEQLSDLCRERDKSNT